MPISYDKFQGIGDSDDEKDHSVEYQRARCADERDDLAALTTRLDRSLKRRIQVLKREASEADRKLHDRVGQLPSREVNEAERQVLARLLAVSHFPDGSHNLHRHVEILELGRHNRWLEEDPGLLRLLCRLHVSVLKSDNPSEEDRRMGRDYGRRRSPREVEEDHQLQECLLCAVNMLAAPKQAKLVGGMLELVQMICTPGTPAAQELRRKYERKEFGKDAVFETLFPSMTKDEKDEEDDSGWGELAFFCVLIIIVVAAMAIGIYLLRDGHIEKSQLGDKLSAASSPSLAQMPEIGPSLPADSAACAADGQQCSRGAAP